MSDVSPKFPSENWDGTTPSNDDLNVDHSPDVDFAKRVRAEVRAAEQSLSTYLTDLGVINTYGAPTTVLTVNALGTGVEWAAAAGGISDVVDDTSPQLGGDLDVYDGSNAHDIISSEANGNIVVTPNGTGKIVLDGLSWPNADGSADQVLKTSGGGVLSWSTPAASGGIDYDVPNPAYDAWTIGEDWTNMGRVATEAQINAMTNCGNGTAVCGTAALGHIARTTNWGASWTDLGQIHSMTNIYSMTYLGKGIIIAGGTSGHILRSTDYGANWTDLGAIHGTDFREGLANNGGGIVVCGADSGRVLRSTDWGANWSDTGTVAGDVRMHRYCWLDNGVLLGGTYNAGHIWRSTNNGVGWSDLGQQYSQTYINDFVDCGGGIVLAATGTTEGHILRSTDYGATWSDIGQQFSQTSVWSLTYMGNGICLGGTINGGKIIRSIDYGLTWSDLGQVGSATAVHTMDYLGNGVALAGSQGGFIWRSTW